AGHVVDGLELGGVVAGAGAADAGAEARRGKADEGVQAGGGGEAEVQVGVAEGGKRVEDIHEHPPSPNGGSGRGLGRRKRPSVGTRLERLVYNGDERQGQRKYA